MATKKQPRPGAECSNTVNSRQRDTYVKLFERCRLAGVPLVQVVASDISEAEGVLAQHVQAGDPMMRWDYSRGAYPIGDDGKSIFQEAKIKEGKESRDLAFLLGQFIGDGRSSDPDVPDNSVIFMHNSQRWINDFGVVQALMILRNKFKLVGATIVLLSTDSTLPVELRGDVVLLEEKLPDADELERIVLSIVDATAEELGEEFPIDDDTLARAVESTRGLNAFQAEQSVALSVNARDGEIDIAQLWQLKASQIEQCPAIKVYSGDDSFDKIGGCDAVKHELRQLIGRVAHERPNAIVWIDEIDKVFAGLGDTSGVTQDQLQMLLTYMQDSEADGYLFYGHPGVAKSAIAKAFGNEARVPTLQLDPGGAKDKHVGQSEQTIRHAFRVIDSISSGKTLWIATCNGMSALPPELVRRFRLGTYFFDLPTTEERDAIWPIYTSKWGLDDSQDRPDDKGWTGDEIKTCCYIAYRTGRTLEEVAPQIVPAVSRYRKSIDSRREEAKESMLSASYPGAYKGPAEEKPKRTNRKRAVRKATADV